MIPRWRKPFFVDRAPKKVRASPDDKLAHVRRNGGCDTPILAAQRTAHGKSGRESEQQACLDEEGQERKWQTRGVNKLTPRRKEKHYLLRMRTTRHLAKYSWYLETVKGESGKNMQGAGSVNEFTLRSATAS